MKIVQEQILFDCLEQFEAGASVEELVAKHPHAAAEIEKFLTVAAHLQQLNLQPSLAAKRQSQKLFLTQAAQLRSAQRQARFSWRSLRRMLLPAASLAMVTVTFAVTLLFASTSALPGDLLYDAKRWMESYQLEQAGDATAVFNLNTQMSRERMREVKALLRTDETADVSFEGLINTKQDSNWIIAGVSVKVNEQTEVAGYAGVGAMVLVNGRTQNGHLYASSIIVLEDAPATTTPSPTATASSTPTTTMTATPTPVSTATDTATAMPTTTTTTAPTVSVTPAATSTPTDGPPTVTGTATAAPPTSTTEPTSVPTAVVNNDNDDDNDNTGDDNGNDNSDDNSGGNNNGNDNSGGDNENNNGGDDNGNDDNGNDNSGGDNDNDNDDNDNDDDDGGNSGSGGNDNGNSNGDNGNDNGRRDDD